MPSGWRATLGQRDGGSLPVAAGAVVLAAGGRCFAEAKRLGTFSTNAAGATGEVTEIALAAGCEARDLDALQYHPNGGLWPASLQGYSIPETTRAYGAVLLNAARRALRRRARRRATSWPRPSCASARRAAA